MVRKRLTQTDRFFQRKHRDGWALTFDDVLLKPRHSSVVPTQTDVSTRLGNISLAIPLVSADMDTVTEAELAKALALEGGLGFLWKHPDIQTQVNWVHAVKYTLNARVDVPITIRATQTINDYDEILRAYNSRFSSLVVVDSHDQVAGLVTSRERSFASRGDELEPIFKFMIPREKLLAVSRDPGVRGAYDLMKRNQVGKLPVLSRDGKLRALYCWTNVKGIVEGQTSKYTTDENGRLRVGANIGVKEDRLERAGALLEAGCDAILIGTAHGDTDNVINAVNEVRKNFRKYDFVLVAGNAATYEGARNLFRAGADVVKVGIGPGAICTTRVESGCGVPQVSAIYEGVRAAREFERGIIGDGGIRYSGDITKALAIGADAVMLGSLFARAEESPGEVSTVKGRKVKAYRGMGSLGAMQENQTQDRYGQAGVEKLVPEGVEGVVPLQGKLEDIAFQLVGGLRSGLGYVGARDLASLRERAVFQHVSSAGVAESHPHDMIITREAPNYTIR